MSDAAGRPKVVEPDLTPEEKETIIRFDKRGDLATVFSEQRGAVSRLLRHPEAEAAEITLVDGSIVDDADALGPEDTVVAFRGTIPVGALKILKSARESSRPSDVISGRVIE